MIIYDEYNHGDNQLHGLFPFVVSRAVQREMGHISSDDNYIWILAKKDDVEIIAFAAIQITHPKAQLRHAYVLPAFRRRGIYTELIQRREAMARKARVVFIRAIIPPFTTDLFTRLGYKAMGKRGKFTTVEKRL